MNIWVIRWVNLDLEIDCVLFALDTNASVSTTSTSQN